MTDIIGRDIAINDLSQWTQRHRPQFHVNGYTAADDDAAASKLHPATCM